MGSARRPLLGSNPLLRGVTKCPITWRPPPTNWLKINVDASFCHESGNGAITVVIRDSNGALQGGIASVVNTGSSLIVESIAVREALILARNLNLGNTIIDILNDDPQFGLTWTPREGNNLAHLTARLKQNNQLLMSLYVEPPNTIRDGNEAGRDRY
ncbi:hypothetical protein PIB30_033489 [Stylosanthes scabra]|uniref:RNase H type-1 domain-containing protein n=1 Tax=Stylosanthes scabra TaxID=79078 RepID=A0ABU6YBC7_9FABA|nr:hypothetical protein [Stylosanthes scabra]